ENADVNLAPPCAQKRPPSPFERLAPLDRLPIDRLLLVRHRLLARASRVPVVGECLEDREIRTVGERTDRFEPDLLKPAEPDIGLAQRPAGDRPLLQQILRTARGC